MSHLNGWPAFIALGLGTELLTKVVHIAEKEGLGHVSGMVMSGNAGMQKVCRKVGFQLRRLPDGDYRADIDLPKSTAATGRHAK